MREGEGGKIWENGIETCVISCMKRVASPGSMHDAGCLGLVHWDGTALFIIVNIRKRVNKCSSKSIVSAECCPHCMCSFSTVPKLKAQFLLV